MKGSIGRIRNGYRIGLSTENERAAGIQIDESTNQEVPAAKGRLMYAALAVIMGLLLQS